MRLVPFPLFPIVDGQCGCGNKECDRPGKHACCEWGELEYGSSVPLPREGAGYGIKTGAAPKGSGIIVLDVDSTEALEKLLEAFPIPDTYTVQTGRGVQFYFEHPGFHVTSSTGALMPQVDIKGDGGMVVGPGSPHRNGRVYTTLDDREPVPAPEWLISWLQARERPTEVQHYPGDLTNPDELARAREKYADYLRNEAPARGPALRGKGDATLFEVVQRGAYDLALPTEDVLSLVREHYDPRCSPMWGDELEERVHHKAHDAKTKSTRPRAEPLPQDFAELFDSGRHTSVEIAPQEQDEGIIWGGWDKPVPPIRYLIQGIAPVDTIGVFVAMGSSLKTWTALSIAKAVACGRPWLDRFAVEQGKAIAIDWESGDYELQRRVRFLDHGSPEPTPLLGRWCMPNARIDDVAFWKGLASIEGLKLVVIDSLCAGQPGVDENDTEAAMPLVLAAHFQKVAVGCVVLFIHHARKNGDGDERAIMRGSTAIYNACDWAFKFENVEETENRRRMSMECVKPYGPRPGDISLELSDKGGLTWFDREPSGQKVTADGESPEAIQSAIKLALQGGPLQTIDLIARAVGKRRQLIALGVRALETTHEIALIDGFGYCLDTENDRRKRVETIVTAYPHANEKQIASMGKVSLDFVTGLILNGMLCRSAEGRYFMTHSRPGRLGTPRDGSSVPPSHPYRGDGGRDASGRFGTDA